MGFRNSAVVVGTSAPVRVVQAQAGDVDCEIRSQSAVDFYVGGSTVSAADGLRVENGQFNAGLRPGDEIWAVSAESGPVQLRVIIRTRLNNSSAVVASGTADAQAVTGAATLVGCSVRETATVAAAAALVLRDGTAATDPARVFIELAANESKQLALPNVEFTNGIFVDRESGTTELVLYYL